ncbi:MAG: glycosyltransferase family 4 protein [Weeksellaceae bacterium]
MKRNTAVIYNPYLDLLGGGERHVLAMGKALQDANWDVTLLWNTDLNTQLQDRLHLDLNRPFLFENNFLKDKAMSKFARMEKLQEYDLFIYVTDGSYFFSSAKKNIVFCMVPQKSLYNMTALNKIKTYNYRFVANSEYTQKWLQKWGVQADVLYPYLGTEFINTDIERLPKQKYILTVGRFFKHLHAKRHDIAIEWFQDLRKKHEQFQDYTLLLAGSFKDEDQAYLDSLKALIGDDKHIELHTNVGYNSLLDLYKKSSYYWHMAGFGIDENETPEKVEHLGITPLEAMGMGCIVMCYASGGPKELIKSGANGFLYKTQAELFEYMLLTLKQKRQTEEIRVIAKEFVKENFSYARFQENMQVIIENL